MCSLLDIFCVYSCYVFDLGDSCLEPGEKWCVVFVCAEQVSILWLAGSSVCGGGLWLL